jgi:hypothetical protein
MGKNKVEMKAKKLKNRRVMLGIRPDGDWQIVFKRLPTEKEKVNGERIHETSIRLSPEAMDALFQLYKICIKDIIKEATNNIPHKLENMIHYQENLRGINEKI